MQAATGETSSTPQAVTGDTATAKASASAAGSDASWSNIGSSQYRRNPPADDSVFGDAQSTAPSSSQWEFHEAAAGYVSDDEPPAADDVQPPAADDVQPPAAQPQAAYASATTKKNIFVCKQTNKKMKL